MPVDALLMKVLVKKKKSLAWLAWLQVHDLISSVSFSHQLLQETTVFFLGIEHVESCGGSIIKCWS